MPPTENTLEREFLRALASGALTFKPLELAASAVPLGPHDPGYDGVLRARWEDPGSEWLFGFQCLSTWTRLALQRFIENGKKLRQQGGLLPLLVTPYLSERHLDELDAAGVSGLDMSGNGLLQAPPRLYVRRSGAKRRFKSGASPTYVYRSWKLTTLVPRVFVREGSFPSVQAVLDACHARMMRKGIAPPPLTLSTVSKALAQLEEDLVVERKGRELRLLHLDRLLNGLARGYRPPTSSMRFVGRTKLTSGQVWATLKELRPDTRVIMTGVASAPRYTELAGPDRLQLYVSDAGRVAAALNATPTELFPNLELIETDEESAYFDPYSDASGTWASVTQTYVELAAAGAREVEAAKLLRVSLLRQPQP